MKSFCPPKFWRVFGILLALVFSAYGLMLQSTFKTMDDEKSIVKNELLRSWNNAGRLLTESFFDEDAYYRPLVSLSFLLEYQIAGLKPALYYFTNIVIHALNAFLVWRILFALFSHSGLAWSVAILFALHPVQWEAVSNIPGRAILMCALFELLAFYSFIRYRQTFQRHNAVFALIWFALALLSKESAAVFPLILAAYLFFFAEGESRTARNSRWLSVLPYVIVLITSIVWRHYLGITKLYYWRDIPEAFLGFTTFLHGGLTYLRILVWPSDLHFDRSHALMTGFTEPGFIFTWIVYAGIIVSLISFWRRLSGPVRFFLAWTVIEFIPVSQFLVTIGVQPGTISIAEHFLYVPSVGIFTLAGLLVLPVVHYIRDRRMGTPSGVKLVAAGGIILLWILTLSEVVISRSEAAMLEHSLLINPKNARLHISLGMLYGQLNQWNPAEKHFREALALDPANVRARISLGKVLVDQGKIWEGLGEYESLKQRGVETPALTQNLTETYKFLVTRYEDMIQADPQSASARYTLGVVYFLKTDYQKASDSFQQAVAVDPAFANAWFNLAAAHEALGEKDDAAAAYQKFLEIPRIDGNLEQQARGRLGQLGYRE